MPMAPGPARTCWSVFGVGRTFRSYVAEGMVESKMGAVAWGHWPAPRFPSPLIEPEVPISGVRLSDWLHRKAHSEAGRGRRSRHSTPRVRWILSNGNPRFARPHSLG